MSPSGVEPSKLTKINHIGAYPTPPPPRVVSPLETTRGLYAKAKTLYCELEFGLSVPLHSGWIRESSIELNYGREG